MGSVFTTEDTEDTETPFGRQGWRPWKGVLRAIRPRFRYVFFGVEGFHVGTFRGEIAFFDRLGD